MYPETLRQHPVTDRPLVLTALLLAMLIAAIEGTIVATAMPAIAAELGEFSLYSWVFSSYLLTQAITIPMFGKLADLFGRKPVFIAGVLIFLIGSALCGLATSMEMLIGFRFLQGAGAGAIQPVAKTLVGDLYALEERGRIQAYISGVWGASSVLGPLTGGMIIKYGEWPWIFWMSIPIGLIAIVLISLFLHERVEAKRHSIDYTGAALFFVGLSALMLVLTQSNAWSGLMLSLLLALAILALVLFVAQERRTPEPMMHLGLWRDPLIALANGATLTAGIVMIGAVSFLPTYVEGVLGGSALLAGFTLSLMSLGWPLSSLLTGRLLASKGSQLTSRIGGSLLLLGALLIAFFLQHGIAGIAVGSFLVGAGLGFLNTTFIVSIQSSVSWERRGAATSSNMLMRILGNALGASIFGGILNLSLQRHIARRDLEGHLSPDSIQHLLGEAGAGMTGLSDQTLQVLHDALARGLHLIFWSVALTALITALLSWRVPNLRR